VLRSTFIQIQVDMQYAVIVACIDAVHGINSIAAWDG